MPVAWHHFTFSIILFNWPSCFFIICTFLNMILFLFTSFGVPPGIIVFWLSYEAVCTCSILTHTSTFRTRQWHIKIRLKPFLSLLRSYSSLSGFQRCNVVRRLKEEKSGYQVTRFSLKPQQMCKCYICGFSWVESII